jgi:hypothetical protein
MYVLFKQQPSSLFNASQVVDSMEELPPATQERQPAASQKGEDCTHCGDTHPTISSAGSGGSCSEKIPEPTTPQRAQRHTQSMINLTVSLDMDGRLIAVQHKHLQADGMTLRQADELSDLLMLEEGIDRLRQSLRPVDYLGPAPEPPRAATDQQEPRCNAAHATPPGTPPESPLDPVRPHSSFCGQPGGFWAPEQQKPRCNAAHATPPGTPPDIGRVAPVTPELPRVVIDLTEPPSWLQRSRSRSRDASRPCADANEPRYRRDAHFPTA